MQPVGAWHVQRDPLHARKRARKAEAGAISPSPDHRRRQRHAGHDADGRTLRRRIQRRIGRSSPRIPACPPTRDRSLRRGRPRSGDDAFLDCDPRHRRGNPRRGNGQGTRGLRTSAARPEFRRLVSRLERAATVRLNRARARSRRRDAIRGAHAVAATIDEGARPVEVVGGKESSAPHVVGIGVLAARPNAREAALTPTSLESVGQGRGDGLKG
jgi:hypothetical protein